MKLLRPNRKILFVLLPPVALLLIAGFCLACRDGAAQAEPAPKAPAAQASAPPRTAQKYHCPMHPDYVSDHEGSCPICGMRLVPVEKAEAKAGTVPGLARVEMSESALHLAGVQTAVAERRTVTRSTRTVGLVTVDETRVRHVHTKNSGWVEKLYVNYTGQAVRAGQPLLALYSPELLATQEEYLRAREAAARFANSELPEVRKGGEDLLTAARRRLELFDVPRSLIQRLDQTGEPQRTVLLLAPTSGYVLGKEIFEGMEVQPGLDLLTVTDLSRVWVEADFYEYESRALSIGQKLSVNLPYESAAPLTGRVSYIYPYINPETRTVKVRIEFSNPGLRLKPGMYVDVVPELGSVEGVVIPDSAVIDTGVRQVVFVESPAAEGVGFEPREVRIGSRGDGQALVLDGLQAGERVAIRANFLLDSESRLRAAVAGMSGSHEHGGGAR